MAITRYFDAVEGVWKPTDSQAINNEKGLRYTAEDIKEIDEKIPNKLSELENDKKYITIEDLPEIDLSDVKSDLKGIKDDVDKLEEGKADKEHTHKEYEEKVNKNKPDGYTGLDAHGKVPLSLLPDLTKQQNYIVDSEEEKDKLVDSEELKTGDMALIVDTGNTYMFNADTKEWVVSSKAEWENINLDWNNITNKPDVDTKDIERAVEGIHEHINKSSLDKITDEFISSVNSHEADNTKHITKIERDKWNKVDSKVDKVEGKDLSSNDLTDELKGKLEGIEAGANKYVHPTKHSADMIVENDTKQFVAKADKTKWNGKADKSDIPTDFIWVSDTPPAEKNLLWVDTSKDI